jgi:hypothetical protein
VIEKNNNKIKGFFIEIPWSFEILFIPKITLSQNGIDLILKSDSFVIDWNFSDSKKLPEFSKDFFICKKVSYLYFS